MCGREFPNVGGDSGSVCGWIGVVLVCGRDFHNVGGDSELVCG